jgi:hypothetical protein
MQFQIFKRDPASGRWNWSPRISQSLGRIPSFQKKNYAAPDSDQD